MTSRLCIRPDQCREGWHVLIDLNDGLGWSILERFDEKENAEQYLTLVRDEPWRRPQ